MKNSHKLFSVLLGASLMVGASWAKLPAPSDEAKAKAAEGAAKAAWTGKLEAYQLCKAQDRVVASYKKTKPSAASACVDPGAFVYPTAVAAPSAAAASAAAVAAKKP